MEYTSFYGGRRGASFVIVKSYPNVAEMVAEFSKGGAYRAVNYDEYVLIDTVDKNDIDNGKIYRRGYEYNNDEGGAVYIGQIVGPTGPAPQVEMKTYKEVEDEYADRGPVDPETGDEYRKSKGEYAPTENLVPGQYNDAIQWVACSIRDKHSNQSTVHVGFIFPYMVTQWTANSVSPYYHRSDAVNKEMGNWDETGSTNTFYNDKLVTRTDDLSHPYFETWDVKIPKGITGDAFKNLRVTTVAECNKQHPGWLQQYAGMDDDEVTEAIKKERKIFVYDYYHYDKDKGGEPVSIYLGDYNEITNIDLAEDGTLTIDYSHNDEKQFTNALKWIKSVSLNTETGHFEIIFNYDEKDGQSTKYETDLRWVKDIEFQDNGSVNLVYTTNTDSGLEYDRLIKWIKEVNLDGETGIFTVTYNYDTDKEGKPTLYEAQLKYINKIEVAEDGTITLKYTTGENIALENKIKWLKNAEVQTGEIEGDGNQKIKITYNDDTTQEIGEPLNYVMKSVIDERFHLLQLFSDPARRQAIKDAGQNATYKERDDWYDLGYIGNGTGVGAVVGKADDAGVQAVAETLPPYSAWFIIEEK